VKIPYSVFPDGFGSSVNESVLPQESTAPEKYSKRA